MPSGVGKCIFCLLEKPLTAEHVIPEYLGGGLKIQAVCADCNAQIGSTFEGQCSKSLLFGLPRLQFGISGKAKAPPNPLAKTGRTADGDKVRLDDNLKPYLIPQIHEETLPDGSLEISLTVDASDSSQVDEILRKKLRKYLKGKNPHTPDAEIEGRVGQLITEAKTTGHKQVSNPTIKMSFSEDIGALSLQFAKIAYELAFHHFGYSYVTDSSTAQLLRDTIKTSDTSAKVRGQILVDLPQVKPLFSDPDCHYCLMLGGGCYTQLFGSLSGCIMFEESNPEFLLSQEESVIYSFNHQSGCWFKKRLIELL